MPLFVRCSFVNQSDSGPLKHTAARYQTPPFSDRNGQKRETGSGTSGGLRSDDGGGIDGGREGGLVCAAPAGCAEARGRHCDRSPTEMPDNVLGHHVDLLPILAAGI